MSLQVGRGGGHRSVTRGDNHDLRVLFEVAQLGGEEILQTWRELIGRLGCKGSTRVDRLLHDAAVGDCDITRWLAFGHVVFFVPHDLLAEAVNESKELSP